MQLNAIANFLQLRVWGLRRDLKAGFVAVDNGRRCMLSLEAAIAY